MHTYGIITNTGEVILTASTREAVIGLAATGGRFAGTPARWVFGTWQPI